MKKMNSGSSKPAANHPWRSDYKSPPKKAPKSSPAGKRGKAAK